MSLATLPPSLLLLVHLHLLGFDSGNGSNYNEHLFDTSIHGGGERIRTMEEITFFLVGKIEGTVPRAKKILPTYPCAQPSDTLAYRNALTKYMESLKHTALHPASNSKESPTTATPWWWKDVIIRKSLLEECFGDRFLRLLLSLSTHALFQHTFDKSLCPSEQDVRLSKLSFADAPDAYASALASFRASRASWEDAAARLNRRQGDLDELKRRLQDPARPADTSKYGRLSTDKLLALRDSRIEDLLGGPWSIQGGSQALYELLDIAGLGISPTEDDSFSDTVQATVLDTDHADKPDSAEPQLSLPIAAAHHPTQLRRLSKPVFLQASKESTSTPESGATTNGPSSQQVMPNRMATESRTGNALRDALAHAEKTGDELKAQLGALEDSQPQREARGHAPASVPGLTLDLWVAPNHSPRRPGREEAPLKRMSVPTRNVQERVDRIRASLKATWPPVPAAQTQADQASRPTRLPQAAAKTAGKTSGHVELKRGKKLHPKMRDI